MGESQGGGTEPKAVGPFHEAWVTIGEAKGTIPLVRANNPTYKDAPYWGGEGEVEGISLGIEFYPFLTLEEGRTTNQLWLSLDGEGIEYENEHDTDFGFSQPDSCLLEWKIAVPKVGSDEKVIVTIRIPF